MSGPTVYRGFVLRYDCNPHALGPLAPRFVQLGFDETTRDYVDEMLERPHGALAGRLHRWLRPALSDFDINGLLGMYRLHLLGPDHFQTLLGPHLGGRLLDVGAGAGDVTSRAAPAFDSVVTTETSLAMSLRLRRRGYRCHRVDLARKGIDESPFDVATCLNVIDRCDRPRTLLRNVADRLAPDGRMVVAVAIPLDPFVYDGGRSLSPTEPIEHESGSWEATARSLAEGFLPSAGLLVEKVARVPYLSQGDQGRRLYTLDDAVFVCRVAPA